MYDLNKAEEVTDKIREGIRNGTYPIGKRLPAERELAKEFDVSRETLRRSLQTLEGEELIVKRGTSGNYVKAEVPRIEVINGLEFLEPKSNEEDIITGDELAKAGSFIINMKRNGRKPKVTFIEPVSLVAANEDIARHLKIKPLSLVLKRYRMQSADNIPYRIIESFYPNELFGEVLQIELGEMPLFEWLKQKHGNQVKYTAEDVTARLPVPHERQLLKISPTTPVIIMNRTVWDENRKVIEWARITAVASLYRFHYEYNINWEKEPTK